jgi:hypothetical protein
LLKLNLALMSAFAVALMGLLVATATASHAQMVKRDGSVEFAGHRMRCSNEPVMLDADLPSEGMYAPGEGIFINPETMALQPVIIRQFIFAHECAHRIVEGDELGADCAAARQGARERWLTQDGIGEVCRDLEQRPADEDHPSGSARCANIKRCFAGAAPEKSPAVTSAWAAKRQVSTFGSNASRPLAESLHRAASTWRSALQ